MAYKSYDILWRSEFYKCLCKRWEQDINLNQLKLKVNDTYKTGEKITTNFESSNAEDVITKT